MDWRACKHVGKQEMLGFRHLKVLLTAPLLALWLLPAAPIAADGCEFILGFKTLHDLDAADIGDCVDNQAFASNGDAQQHTTKGLMAWRKADNWTAFTNGYMTWINGPQGLASRLNTDRFTWEAQLPPPQAPATPTATPVVTVAATTPTPTAPVAVPTYGPISTSGPSGGNTGEPFAPAGTGFTITIDDALGFQPQFMTIRTGDCVTWVNVRGDMVHSVVSDPGSPQGWDSGGLDKNKSFGQCFRQPGKYGYHSSIEGYPGIDSFTQMPTIIYPFTGAITVVPK